ncbi:gamma-glutamyltranspeptidase [Piedraia hortae CBS 480.64]|uniref:Glutathione hydrolase n=1 Tax=Piedraia hortae CBS 480.64 TaxID=1314780 RepID=A0A6A7C0M1_9PEZI|nr:gamma-glutamyltranspeptidase [Piedraia hortae CBS 480.64]
MRQTLASLLLSAACLAYPLNQTEHISHLSTPDLTVSNEPDGHDHCAVRNFTHRQILQAENNSVYVGQNHGGVACEVEICSHIGAVVIEDGGNAADAIVASTLCVGVIGMHHSGIGGGGFVLVRDAHGKYDFIDFRETAPAASFEDMFVNSSKSTTEGGLAVAVPGELRGLSTLHERHGRLSWRRLITPAANLARYGFPVTPELHQAINRTIDQVGHNIFLDDPSWAVDFAPNGILLQAGDTMTRQRLADTLEAVAQNGTDAFYTGSRANSLIAAVQSEGGIITSEDLANYSVKIRSPATIDYRGYKIFGGTAPSSGVVTLNVMEAIENFDDMGTPSAINQSTHRLDEAIRFGYGLRALEGDPDYILDTPKLERYMISDEMKATNCKRIGAKSQDSHAYNPQSYDSPDKPGTSGLVSADSSGMTVSLTTTLNRFFGSLVIVPDTGVILNNQMDDFSTPGKSNSFGYIPSPANFIRPGKRPLSSVCPIIVETADRKPYFVTAGAGGSRIITTTIQQLWNVLDRNMTAAEALKDHRLHDQLVPEEVVFEYGYNNSTVEYLAQTGHKVRWVPPILSAQHSIRFLENGLEAAAEPRQKSSGAAVV